MQLGLEAGDAFPEDLTQLAVGFDYTLLDRELEGSRSVETSDSPSLSASLAWLSARHHFGEGLSADLRLPTGVISLEPGAGAPTERTAGLGDIEVAGRFDFQSLWGFGLGRPSAALRLGVSLPTGEQVKLAEDVVGVPREVVALGWGTFGLAAELELTWFFGRSVAVSLPVGVRLPLGRNPNGLFFGPALRYGVGGLVVLVPELMLAARLAGSHRARSNHETNGELLNSGGDHLAAELGVTARINASVHVGARARLPVYAHTRGRQLSETFSVGGFFSVTLGGGSDDADEHDDHHVHDHHGDAQGEHHHEHPGGDVADLATGGATFDLAAALVADKVTVIDFWASWCEPCHLIDERLERLAAAHPDLAVRRVEVPTFETPVATEHLGDLDALPILWIYDPAGRRVAELVGVTADEAIERVELVLRQSATGPD